MQRLTFASKISRLVQETENNSFSIVCFGPLDYLLLRKMPLPFPVPSAMCFWERLVFASQSLRLAQILKLLTTVKLLDFRNS